MKAIYFEENGGPEVLRYGDFPTPSPEPGWVKIKVKACSLNYLDIFSRRGMPGIKPLLPGISGGDVAGEITALGEGVKGWTTGQRVVIYPPFIDFDNGVFEMMGETRHGGLAEYCLARAEQLIPIPDGVSDIDAACIPVAYGTAHRMLFERGQVKAGETMLVIGASGGVGNACVLLGKNAGMAVIGAAGGADKCEKLLQLGCDQVIDYKAEAFDKKIRKMTGSLFAGGGVDVVINFTGGDTWVPSLRCVKRFGRLLTCGATAGYSPQTDIRYIYTAEMNIVGATGFEKSDIVSCLDMIAEGQLSPVVDKVFALEDGITALRAMEDRTFFGKLVVKP